MIDLAWGGESRKQIDAKDYSECVRSIGKEFNIPVVDVWGAFMRSVGWRDGDGLVGIRERGVNVGLARLLYDGMFLLMFNFQFKFVSAMRIDDAIRSPSQ